MKKVEIVDDEIIDNSELCKREEYLFNEEAREKHMYKRLEINVIRVR